MLGTNEEYRSGSGDEGDFNAGPLNAAAVAALQQAGDQIGFGVANANGRVYALHADGESHAGRPVRGRLAGEARPADVRAAAGGGRGR